MHFDLEQRSLALGAGEFADFSLGPRESGGGPQGLWRAQLGQRWHAELRARTEKESGAAASFEVPVAGRLSRRGWTFHLNGRIDQVVGTALREIKTITLPLPAAEEELRAGYPGYFLQLAVYVLLQRSLGLPVAGAELVFVEVGSGVVQAVALTPFDEALVHHQLDLLVEFLEQRRKAADRRRHLAFRPPFVHLRPGQETVAADLLGALNPEPAERAGPEPVEGTGRVILFEAPTGFGKTGCLLDFALRQLRGGRFERLVWLTGKATGQLHVMETLRAMVDPAAAPSAGDLPVTAWQVRPKSEHCVNHTFHCLRDACGYIDGAAERWPQSGLARFYLDDAQPHELPALRAAGNGARICPYEITRTALAFQDVWLGDFNYVFAPDTRGVFLDQPGYDPARTLLVVDEAHNLPSRVADAHSHTVRAAPLRAALSALQSLRVPAPLLLAWDQWARLIGGLEPVAELDPGQRDEVVAALETLAPLITGSSVDHAALGPEVSGILWETVGLAEWIHDESMSRLLWSPRAGELQFSCLDAAPVIGQILRGFGAAVLMSATLSPPDAFATACGLGPAEEPPPPVSPAAPAPEKLGQLTKRQTRKLYHQLSTGADLLRVEEARDAAQPAVVRASAPWRDNAYDVAVDLRVDTTFRERARHYDQTAAAIAAMQGSPGPAGGGRRVAVFFPSYAYADSVLKALATYHPATRAVIQPRLPDLAAQAGWVEENLAAPGALCFVLGGSFAEGVDLLGGRVDHAVVVSPALPEVNAVQKARVAAAERGGLGREEAFRQVYQLPGMQKVNQALGRLVRAPGQRARVLLHCRRFADPSYAALLAPEYRRGRTVADDAEFTRWLDGA